MQKRIQRAFISLREHTRVNYAKIATIGGFLDIDLIVIKATSPNDMPLQEKYVHELLKIFAMSHSSFRAFSLSFTRRFGKTRCWRVALKCLVLLHRLLRSLPDDSPFRADLLQAKTNGLMSLYPSHFCDSSSSNSKDYTFFIRSYAHLLDQALICPTIEGNVTQEEVLDQDQPEKMKKLDQIIETLPELQALIDLVIACRPKGAAGQNYIVQLAMKHIIRDSFTCYTTFRREIVHVLDNLIQLPYISCVAAFGIYKKAAIQASQLSEFYHWCKCLELCGSYEYPFVDEIPELQIRALGEFLNGMWQLTDDRSSSTSSHVPLMLFTTSSTQSPLSLIDTDTDKQPLMKPKEKLVTKSEDKCEEMKPLIQFDEENDSTWEDLLEASIISTSTTSCMATSRKSYSRQGLIEEQEINGWQKQRIYHNNYYNHNNNNNNNPYVVYPPNHPHYYKQHQNPMHAASCPSSPMYPWGL